MLEAQFSGHMRATFKPEPDELIKIEQKLKNGLPEESSAADAKPSMQKKPDDGG